MNKVLGDANRHKFVADQEINSDPTPHIGATYNFFVQDIIDCLVMDFGLGLRAVVVYHVPGVPGTVCSGGLAGFSGRGCRGEGVL